MGDKSERIFSGIKFLIIDDIANYANMLKSSVLRRGGATDIDTASDGEKALKMMSRKKYDVVLCDFNLGDGQNGQQILDEGMHTNTISHHTIFIMITAENAAHMVMSAIEYKPDAYLTKPFTQETLASRVKKIQEKRKVTKKISMAIDNMDYKKAILLCDEAMKKSPRYTMDIAKIKGEMCLKDNNDRLAEKVYSKILTIREFPWAMFGLAKVKMIQQLYTEAIKILQDLISKNKTYMPAYDLAAEAYVYMDDYNSAQLMLKRAIELSPHIIQRQKSLGQISLKNEDLDQAEQSFKKAIVLAKNSYHKDADDQMGLAKVYIVQKKATEALELIEYVKKEYRGDPTNVLHAIIIEGMLYKMAGHEDKAKNIFEDSLKEYIDRADKISQVITEDMADSCVLFEEQDMADALKEDAKNPDVSQSSWDKAHKYRCLQLNREGIHLYQDYKIKESMPLFEKAAKGLPDNISINMNAAQVLIISMQNYGKDKSVMRRARSYLDVVRSLDPKNEKYQKLELMFEEIAK